MTDNAKPAPRPADEIQEVLPDAQACPGTPLPDYFELGTYPTPEKPGERYSSFRLVNSIEEAHRLGQERQRW